MKALKTLSILVVAALLAVACKRQAPLPDGIIGMEPMADILTQAHLMDAYYYVNSNQRYGTVHQMASDSYDTLLGAYGVTRADFDTSMSYYSQRPDLLVALYEQVDANLKALQP